ncbi:hypothetical protein [Pseudodesulfovibrio sp. zrk46]|uniref:hypothetical protein n=1 Tax=Pseudodesulfovibrio sp. zrk46 TaxID=2725288 RepID=UPI001449313C|nr:hypothetical protein [Pseudodesulfovibrio sp. zrk46]QJB56527.1 hypothetical protein HFN16_08945 [Pseudodesulfovibrio sp. zrk46]
MAKDFRELLVEASRHDVFGRFYKELQVGLKVVVSFQASANHCCEPAETLDDPYAYTKWEVILRQADKNITIPKVGAWDFLKHNVWAQKFDQPEFQTCVIGEFLTVWEAQRCYEDVIEYAMIKKHIESEDDIRVVEPDENLKKTSGCGGCGGKKKAVAEKVG